MEDAAVTTVLAIHAHPDDIEFQCAGTLLRLAERGASLHLVTMTPGDCGSAEMTSEEISDVRRAEASAAAELLGASYRCLEFRDLSIVFDNPSRQRVTECLRQVRPDIVLTAPPVDYMPDHEMTSLLVRDACFNAPIPNYKTAAADPAAPLDAIPHLYYVDAIEGVDWFGRPQPAGFVVDVSEQFERKLEMLACHESQRGWLLKQHGMDEYLESCRRWGASRGGDIGTDYGEAFRQHLGHPYPGDNLLETLLSAQ